MKSSHLGKVFVASASLIALAGCGTGVGNGNLVTAHSSDGCVTCHGVTISKATGTNIVAEWKASKHAVMNVAGCVECHEGSTNHGGDSTCSGCHGGGSSLPVIVSDAAGKCGLCHGEEHPNDIMARRTPAHFNNATSLNRYMSSGNASYLSGEYKGKCRQCHNPHDPSTTMEYSRKWAESGHANTTGGPYVGNRTGSNRRGLLKLFGTDVPADRAFFYANPSFNYTGSTDATRDSEASRAYEKFGNSNTLEIKYSIDGEYSLATFTPGCVRCHTTTGFVNFVKSGFSSLKPFGAGDPSKELTACNACHENNNGTGYGGMILNVPAIAIYYNFSSSFGSATANTHLLKTIKVSGAEAKVTYADYGYSNSCVACHTGRAMGDALYLMKSKIAALGFTNLSTVYGNTSIPSAHDFASGGTLGRKVGFHFPGKDYSEAARHDTIGMSGSKQTGPCVGCHMNMANGPDSHLFEAVTYGDTIADSATYTGTNEQGRLKIASIESRACTACHGSTRTASFLSTQKLQYISALTVLRKCLDRTVSSGNYTKVGYGADDYVKTMGASFNRGYLTNEAGAYIHSPRYTKRLIYDSIDWLRTYNRSSSQINQLSVYDTIVWLSTDAAGSQKISVTMADDAIKWLYGSQYSTTVVPPDTAARP